MYSPGNERPLRSDKTSQRYNLERPVVHLARQVRRSTHLPVHLHLGLARRVVATTLLRLLLLLLLLNVLLGRVLLLLLLLLLHVRLREWRGRGAGTVRDIARARAVRCLIEGLVGRRTMQALFHRVGAADCAEEMRRSVDAKQLYEHAEHKHHQGKRVLSETFLLGVQRAEHDVQQQ